MGLDIKSLSKNQNVNITKNILLNNFSNIVASTYVKSLPGNSKVIKYQLHLDTRFTLDSIVDTEGKGVVVGDLQGVILFPGSSESPGARERGGAPCYPAMLSN
jgi:hypothetical protein